MANELTTQFSLSYAKGGDAFAITPIKSLVTISSGIRAFQVQSVPTAYAALDIGAVAANDGMFYAINLDGTNYVEIGRQIAAAFEGFAKLAPGRLCYLGGVSDRNLYGRSNTAACKVMFLLMEP